MKADINRRAAISGLALLPTLAQTLLPSFAQAQESQAAPLASWNDGPAKQAIIDFVRATTDQTGSKFVPAEDRVATFDQDGTLWVEHPMYTQVVYCLERVPAVVAQKQHDRYWHLNKLQDRMSAFGGKADITRTCLMSAFDPKRT